MLYVNNMQNFNFVIATDKNTGSISDLEGSGWVGVNISEYQLSSTNGRIFDTANNRTVGVTGATGTVCASVENIALAQICPAETFSDSSSGVSFSEFEEQILGNTALFSNDYFPSNAYGIDISQAPLDILESNTLTYDEKAALTLAISFREAGYYVLVISKKGQVSYQNFLKKYNISKNISI